MAPELRAGRRTVTASRARESRSTRSCPAGVLARLPVAEGLAAGCAVADARRMVAACYLAVNSSRADRAVPRLPATPRTWLDAYEAAAIDKPSRVCLQLVAPDLASIYARAAHGSCSRYFERMTSSSVTVRRIARHGPTAVLELRQNAQPRELGRRADPRRDRLAGGRPAGCITPPRATRHRTLADSV